jgi:Flp pilus assembly protein TadB
MNKMRKELKEILHTNVRDLHGKKRYLSYLVSILLGIAGGLLVVLVGKYSSYRVYQIFVAIAILLVVWLFGIREREMLEEKD